MQRRRGPKPKPIPTQNSGSTDRPKRGRPTRPATEAERKRVAALCAYGMPWHVIAMVMGWDTRALKRRCAHELNTSLHLANAKVAEVMYNRAVNPAAPASMQAGKFWLEARAGWKGGPAGRDPDDNEPAGTTVNVNVSAPADLRTMSIEDLNALITRLLARRDG